MYRNYLKIALRTLWKNKKLAAINIFGLATGMACTLLIFMFVRDELSYDRHHANAENIYRVVKDFINDDGSLIPDATTPGPLSAAMMREIPGIVSITRIHPNWGNSWTVAHEDNKIVESGLWRVDSSFFDVFSFRFIQGDPKSALTDAGAVVLTESAARRHFGNEDPIGKTLKVDDQYDLTVTAVIEDVPPQSHFHFSFLLSWRRLGKEADSNWGSYNYYTYVKVQRGTDMRAFDKKVQGVYERNQQDRYSAFYTQPLLSIHLNSKLKWELEANGDQLYVYVFVMIGTFILLIAAINYINLSTAKSSLRAKETGIRKVSGAERSSLVFQFLMESIILSVVAGLLALTIAYASLPAVNELTQKQLTIDGNLPVVLFLLGTTLLVGLAAGIFPALYLSSFKPISVLKGLSVTETGALTLRKSLVILQFTISIAMIISTLIITQQMGFIQSAKLGMDKDHVVVVRNGRGLTRAERVAFLNAAEQIHGVEKIALSAGVMGQGFSTTRISARGSDKTQQLNFTSIGYNYLNVVGMEMKEGRQFSAHFPADSLNNGVSGGPLDQRLGGIIINERAAQEFGLGSPAVGKQLLWSNDGDTTYYVDVVGVVKDFNFTSLRNEIKPFGFVMTPRNLTNFTIKLSGDKVPETMRALEGLWRQSFRDTSFDYTFIDETYANMYKAEARFQRVFVTLVILGIIIACLGLFALATFSAERRLREISIRKVLGATAAHVVVLLSTDFLKLVIAALVLAIPLAWYAMNKWLSGFAYHVSLQWWVFAVAALMALSIAFLTICTQALKAAFTNPAKSLRSE